MFCFSLKDDEINSFTSTDHLRIFFYFSKRYEKFWCDSFLQHTYAVLQNSNISVNLLM